MAIWDIITKRLFGGTEDLVSSHDGAVCGEDEAQQRGGGDIRALNGVRFRKLVRRCMTGDRAGAELELFDWARHADCPVEARLLLASLWARRGLHHDALHVLHGWARLDQDDPAHEDPRIGQLITAIMITSGKDSAAARRAGQLHHDHGFEPTVSRWLEMIEAPGVTDAPHATIEHMASQLVERPEVISSLVTAQKYDPDETEIHLLRRSISRASRDLSQDSLVICQAMAELAVLVNDAHDARRWAHRGLKIEPNSAQLAMILGGISDDPAVGPAAATVLAAAVEAHPDHADLRAALIRREMADGRVDVARQRLSQWKQQRPDDDLDQIQRELAA